MQIRYLVPLAVALSSHAVAEPLSFGTALERAAANAPILDARTRQVEARESGEIAAGELPDPILGVGLDNFPVSGPPAFSLSRDNMTMERLSLEQALPNLARRRADRGVAQAGTVLARARAGEELRRVKVGTAIAWVDAAFAQRRLEAIDAAVSRVERLVGPSVAAVAAGGARPGQSLAVQQEVARLADRRDAVLAERRTALAQLARWTGSADAEPAGEVPQFAVSDEGLRLALLHHPLNHVASANSDRAVAEADAARAELRPDWGLGLSFQRRDPQFGNMISVGATMTLPLFTDRRQAPRIAAANADAAAARAEQQDVQLALEAELETALAEHAMYHRQWQRASDILLPLARQEAELETVSYGAGRAGLIDVVSSQVRLSEAELDTLDREAALARHEALLALWFGDRP